MAHNVEPMDIDIESDFDNKENSIHHSNVYPRTPCTEKGYEELDVSELNMKLRYSITPASSPMSKSFTANCNDNRSLESGDDIINSNLTRSLHSAIPKDFANKTVKQLPLQTISSEQFVDSNRNAAVLRPLDTTSVIDSDITVTITGSNDADENISLPSSSSSTAQTPEATTPTKDIPRNDGGSPIMRGLKSVLNMFRSSQSPIPPADSADGVMKQSLSLAEVTPDSSLQPDASAVLASTPLAVNKHKESNLSKRSSPLKESLVFNEDLERELLWKDETTILFSDEKIPIHKLFFQQGSSGREIAKNAEMDKIDTDFNSTVEYMDISCNDSMIKNRTVTELQAEAVHGNESDAEFVDCETTFTNDKIESNEIGSVNKADNESNFTGTVTDMVSAIDADDSNTNTEAAVKIEFPSVTEDGVSECQVPEVTTSLNEDTDISQVKSEPETKHIEEDNSINTTNILSDIKKEAYESNTSVNIDCDIAIIITESNVKPEINIPLDATFDTPNILDNVHSNKEVQPDYNESQNNKNFETKEISAVVEIQPTTSTDDIEAPKLPQTPETCSIIVPDSTSPSTENQEKIVKKTENVLSVLDITNNTNVHVKEAQVPNESTIKEIVPANVPLPDDEDMENEKSIGAVILVQEVSLSSISHDKTASALENVDQVENMPTEPDKSTDNIINDQVAIKDLTAINSENTSHQIEPSDDDKVASCENNSSGICHSPVQEEIKQVVEMLPINELTDINDIVSDLQAMDGVLQENTENKSQKVDITAEQFEDILDKTVQIYCNTALETQTDVNTDQDKIIKKDVNETVHLAESVDDPHATREEIQQANEPEINIADNFFMNQKASMLNLINEEQLINESQKDVLNETAVFNDIILEKPISKDEKGIIQLGTDITPMKSEEVAEMDLCPEKIEITEAPIVPFEDTSVLQNNKDNDPATELVMPEIVTNKDIEVVDTVNDKVEDKVKKDEEIILSENNSPYVSLAADIENPVQLNFEEIENPTRTKVVVTPPSSPKIVSKGYNFNFDEIDDPFATKTKIRMSPTVDTPDKLSKEVDTIFAGKPLQRDVNINRRKSQPERKKPTMPKKKMNSTFSGSVNVPNTKSNIKPEDDEPPAKAIIEDKDNQAQDPQQDEFSELKLVSPKHFEIETPLEIAVQHSTSPDLEKELKSVDVRDIDTTMEVVTDENKSAEEILNAVSIETKNTSSSEQSTYYSAGTSSSEGSRNIFNLPEIDDMNFNPFVTKSRMGQSPPPSLNASSSLGATEGLLSASDAVKSNVTFTENTFETKSKMRQSPPPPLNASTSMNATQVFSSESPPKSDATFTENPFETKSKMRLSPPPTLNTTATLNTTQEIVCSSGTTQKLQSDSTFTEVCTDEYALNKEVEAKILGTFDEKEYANLSNTTCSSKATDEKDLTVREVHTEDEDTIEGPFLEADLNNDDKMSDFDGEDVDMMQFSELPAQNPEENVDGGELFIDAEAFEFLLNQNKSNVVTDSGKESLFLKFDPLFAKRMSSDGVLAALIKRQSTPKKMSVAAQIDATFDKSIAGQSAINTTQEVATSSSSLAEESTDDFNVTVTKPMMVVTPAVNPIVTPRHRTSTPPSSHRRSITFTSPAIAVIDRLLSLSANNSLVDTTVTHMSREQNEADLALTQLRELLAEKEINVYNLRTESKELKDRLSTMESQMRILESESQDRLRKINTLNEKLTEKTKINKSMAAVVEEYERTIASLIAETEQDRKRNNEERIRLIKERDEQTAHLASMEVSFSDLHSKYEKSKQIILTCKANEDAYKKSIKEFEENLIKMQSNYELLKQHATSKLNHANQELEKMNRSHEAEVLKLNAMIKRKDLHITSLEETLAQKTKANEELTAICDELINKVG